MSEEMVRSFAYEKSARKLAEKIGGTVERGEAGSFIVRPPKVETAVAVMDAPPPAAEVEIPPYLVVARSQAEMQLAKDRLEEWFTQKVKVETAQRDELAVMVDQAAGRGWNITGLPGQLARQKARLTFYEKCLAAVKAGYSIVPEFPIDIFAVRTSLAHPRHQLAESKYSRPRINDEQTQRLPAGEGRYVSERQAVHNGEYQESGKDGKSVTVWTQTPAGFLDPEFPIAMANVVMMNAAQEAMALKLFDEIGICPPRTGADPMLIGRIGYGRSTSRRTMSFLIGWWLDLRTL